ncbi:outer membrane protein assembly factor BamE [Caenimonas terrae]|uniref:Outer membrane protein assembly factor BamE n=1 Tax=Caenimonas terrae TaxID=696074 RepID=A0ABW0NBN9_9BURK
MSRPNAPALRIFLVAACAALSACSAIDGATMRVAKSITPYQVEVVQGNFVSREQVEALRPGMTRQQVREVLGTPLLASVFHADRWDYVFTLKRKGVDPQSRHLTVFFKDNAMDRYEGDPMPSESEFVATLDKASSKRSMPVLEATEAQLSRFQGTPAAAATPPPVELPAPVNYPPLEAPAR